MKLAINLPLEVFWQALGEAVALALAGQDPGVPTFDCDGIRKDLRLMLIEAKSHGIELPVAARALKVFDEASSAGWGGRDGAELPAYWSRRTAGG